MRRTAALLLCVLPAPLAARAQAAFEPHLAFVLGLGSTGSRALWSVGNQPEFVQGSGGPLAAALFDTLALGRTLHPGPMVTVGTTYYKTPKLGIGGELSFFGIRSQQHCGPVAPYHAEPEHFNQQLCENADGRRYTTSVVGLVVGGVYRLSSGAVQPYLRAGAGLGVSLRSMVETTARVTSARCGGAPDCEFLIYTADRRAALSPLASLAAGIAIEVGPGTAMKLEVRDLIARLPVANATAPNQPSTRVSYSMPHVVTLALAVEMVYASRHGRRY